MFDPSTGRFVDENDQGMNDLTIRAEMKSGLLLIKIAYNEAANEEFRRIGGKFDSSLKAWTFGSVVAKDAAQFLNTRYGWTPDAELVTARVSIPDTKDSPGHGWGCPLYVDGWKIAKHWGRDSDVSFLDGIVVRSGKAEVHGSAKYNSIYTYDLVVDLIGVPRAWAESYPGAEVIESEVNESTTLEDLF